LLDRTKVLFTLVGVAEATILPFIPLLLLERGLPASEIGLLLAAMALAGLVANPLWGYAGDRWLGTERAFAASALGGAALAVVLAAADGTAAFVVAALALFAWRSPLMSLADAMALDRLVQADGGGYARIRLWMSVGWAVAVVGWGALLQTGSLVLAPVLYAVTLLAVGVCGLSVARPARLRRREHLAEPGEVAAVLPRLLAFLVSLLLVNAGFTATFNFLALRIDGLGGGAFLVGVAASLQAVAEVPAMLATPRLTRFLGHGALYVAGCAFYATVFVAWAVITDPVAIAILKLVAGVGFALTYVGAVVLVDDLVPLRLRATGQGVAKAVVFGLAPIAGAAFGGLVYAYLGPSEFFLTAAAAAVAGGVVAWFAIPREARL
jgi:MFS family permease